MLKFAATVLATSSVIVLSVISAPIRRDVNSDLIPEFGLEAGINPTGTGDCDGITGANGSPILIPCVCPPERDTFIQSLNANVNAGFVINNPSVQVSFPEDDSQASQLARIQTALVTLQNINGTGKGCPAASTTFVAQQKAIQEGTTAASSSSAAASSSSPLSSSATSSSAPATVTFSVASDNSTVTDTTNSTVDPSLVPEFGIEAGVNPSGTGNCDGTTGADGNPVLIPCSCPPERTSFIKSLSANVAAGHAVNNTAVAIDFPTDNSTASQITRITAVLISLQNLEGPGVGCPASSTTLLAQMKALQAQL
ncbi:uncharacterized protein BT62DRAFT_934381 [Guyanagaster necrorhizus]|uniref:Uncharacterized protein n=1 Tax=Guyanagaster necrorhizus TaxID=856835 RepID=A0A9P7VPA8_9AGAR|nr:uncharacterized protein BT62DRAFT_934381 [Guyanagaster necrorhizus MCA 3950]KAG7444203.1 hypothetical protein BT62DRAFT_934381 [Guyanagaster necrorhizus MCA 3950]